MNVNLELRGHAGVLTNPLTRAVIKSFPVFKMGAIPFRQKVTAYIKLKNLFVVNTDSLTWNPND